MNVQELLMQQVKGYHEILELTVGDCGQDTLDKNLPGATITSIGSIYAHVILSEDFIVHGMLQGKPALCQAPGWSSRTNVSLPSGPEFKPEWARGVKLNLKAFQEYAKSVYAATEAYVAGLSDSDLDRKVDTGFIGQQTVGFVVTNILAWHVAEHGGEIAALKGVQGLKGLPF